MSRFALATILGMVVSLPASAGLPPRPSCSGTLPGR
jgi:hypothetical protein